MRLESIFGNYDDRGDHIILAKIKYRFKRKLYKQKYYYLCVNIKFHLLLFCSILNGILKYTEKNGGILPNSEWLMFDI